MDFETLIKAELTELEEQMMPRAQKEAVANLTKSGWEITEKQDDAVKVSKDSSTVSVDSKGRMTVVAEDTTYDVTDLVKEYVAEGHEIDTDRLVACKQARNEGNES